MRRRFNKVEELEPGSSINERIAKTIIRHRALVWPPDEQSEHKQVSLIFVDRVGSYWKVYYLDIFNDQEIEPIYFADSFPGVDSYNIASRVLLHINDYRVQAMRIEDGGNWSQLIERKNGKP